MILTPTPPEDAKKKLLDFKEKYIHLYPDYLQEEIEEKLLLGFTNNNDTINQIYSYLNVVDDNINLYKEFLRILEKHFDLNCNILEVGAGTIPILAKYINDNHKCNLTLIEPNIIFEDLLECNIIKEKFTNQTDISKYDLIIGYNPCQATENIIRNSIEQNKNFCIALCGCCFLPENYTDRTPKTWHKYLIELASQLSQNNYEITLLYFEQKYHIEHPIIIGKRKN